MRTVYVMYTFRLRSNYILPHAEWELQLQSMDKFPMKARATLKEIFPVRVDSQMKQDLAVLNAKDVDVAELVRSFLRTQIPKIKKKLETA